MKHVACTLWSDVLREASRWRRGPGVGRGARHSDLKDVYEEMAEMGRGKEHWAVQLKVAFRELASREG